MGQHYQLGDACSIPFLSMKEFIDLTKVGGAGFSA
jgi:hypothetical protein